MGMPALDDADNATIARECELVPIPSAHVVRGEHGFAFVAFNRPYRLSGLGTIAERSPMLGSLADRIDAFLAGDAYETSLAWSIGEAIDCRYYQVTLARADPAERRRCAVSFLDQTAQHLSERSLRREMATDSLTGLPNREGFDDLLEGLGEIARHSVLVVDLERFGRINACLGGLAGDELLITVARRIKGALRASDTLARIGGDEFGVLVRIGTDDDEARQVADRIRRALATPFRLSDYEISVDCAIGIAHGSDVGDDIEAFVRHAQFATKGAKDSGHTETYQAHAFTIAREQFGLETRLRRAIEGGALRLSYQPIHDLATGRLVAFESLARWTDETGREVAPDEFIPVAEESGLIVPLGRWAIEDATRTLAQWDAALGGDCGIKVAVNLSPIQLQRDPIVTLVERALATTGLAGSRLKLELTESALIAEPERTATTLHALKDLGATIVMDDFGTGYSNLAFLQQLPIDLLKIDRSFVTGMLADRDNAAIVRAILSLAQALNMRTVAEGVETYELVQTLAALGCTYGQGYYFSRPLEAAEALALLLPSADETTSSAI